MTRNKTLFIAFAGPAIEQAHLVLAISDGYECWNLKNVDFDAFIETLKAKIPPVNDNVLRNYESKDENQFGITRAQFEKCSWGLMIPDCIDDAIVSAYGEALFLLNLYSPEFLYPMFYASDFGIMPQSHGKPILFFAHQQNQSSIFKTTEFVRFFKTLLPQSGYGAWQLYRVQKWDRDDWRLFVAAMLFTGLKDYDNSKDSFGWQRESADMATILECLFTAGDSRNEEVGYRLRKRMAVLLSNRFPSIEKDVRELYEHRSAFVHGSFFAQIAKDTKLTDGGPPVPNFNLLHRQREYVRWAVVAYLRLAQVVKTAPGEFGKPESVMAVLESAIIDVGLRTRVLDAVEPILSLLSVKATANE